MNLKESTLRQKSIMCWLKKGYSNSNFFHKALRQRYRRNCLVGLDLAMGRISEVKDVKMEVKNHFEKLFKESNFYRPLLEGVDFKRLTSSDRYFLEFPFQVEEIKEVIWSMDSDKSMGQNIFNLEFFKTCWEVVKIDVIRFINEFYLCAKLLKVVTVTFLALIPKVDNYQTLDEFRPTSLIGSLYKIIAKFLASRVKKVLDGLIIKEKYTFLAGRQMVDEILVVNKLVHFVKRFKKECLLVKVDFSKFYDNVPQYFLRYVMRRMRFGPTWMN